jgi:cell division protein FtsZ
VEVENDFISSNQLQKSREEVIPEENITMKQVDATTKANTKFEEFPMEMTIEETLRLRADERRKIKRIQL